MTALKYSLLLLILTACGIGGPLREDEPASGYTLGSLPRERWAAQKSESGADTVFENRKTQAVLAVNSVCDRYPEARLESLAKQLMTPFTDLHIENQEKRLLDKREALWTRIRGQLDGVPVESWLVVFRKDNCIFDFQLHAKDKLAVQDENDFTKFVDGFRFGSSRTETKTEAKP